jgi:hypothetical protein
VLLPEAVLGLGPVVLGSAALPEVVLDF